MGNSSRDQYYVESEGIVVCEWIACARHAVTSNHVVMHRMHEKRRRGGEEERVKGVPGPEFDKRDSRRVACSSVQPQRTRRTRAE